MTYYLKVPQVEPNDISIFITKQVLKVCRTPGPSPCLKLLHKVYLFCITI